MSLVGFWIPQLRDVSTIRLGQPCEAPQPGSITVEAMREISNTELIAARIPDPEAELWGWERFAHTINGYEVMGGFEACADLANRGIPFTLTELRCCLFFEARRERHSGGMSTNEEWIRDLLRAIRRMVEAGEVD